MNQNKHLLLWSSLGVLALLLFAWSDENVFREWRRIQRATKTAAGPLDVRLRQVNVPGLRANDRCVSCHVGMAPGESGLIGGKVVCEHPQVGHEPTEFGCTVCHGGQGRATDKADAHGDVHFWPEPMVPTKHAYAGCGTCHTHLRVPSQNVLKDGVALVERFDCLACHSLDGRGGTLRPDGASGMPGPDLTRIGAKGIAPDWYEKHLKKAKQSTGPWTSSFGSIGEADRRAIETYLASRVGAPGLVEAKALFHSLGCRGCHKVGGVGGDDGPDLTISGQKDPALLNFTHAKGPHTVANWHAEHLRAPGRIVPESKMPYFALADEQINRLTLYIMSLRRSNLPEAYWPKDRVRAERLGEREFATDGATLFGTFCAACHGTNGEGRRFPNNTVFPAVANPDFLAVATDDFISAAVTHGRPGRRMPAWGEKEGGLRPEEIESVVAHLRRASGEKGPLAGDTPHRWVRAELAGAGKALFETHCASCHGRTGDGVDAPQLSNQALLAAATDTYLVETIKRGRRDTVMRGFAKGTTVTPSLAPEEIEAIVAFIRTWEKAQ
jgi:mono/diheme cytochrome c family protein